MCASCIFDFACVFHASVHNFLAISYRVSVREGVGPMGDVQCVFNNHISVTYCGVGTGEWGSRPVLQSRAFGVRLTHLTSIAQGP